LPYISGQGPWGFKLDVFNLFLEKHLSKKENFKETKGDASKDVLDSNSVNALES